MSLPTIAFVVAVHSLDEQNAAYTAAQNFIDIYEDETEEILILGPTDCTINRKNIDIMTVPRNPPTNTILRIFDYIWYQIRLAFEIFRVRNRCSSVFFHIGGTILLLPILISRLSNIYTNVFVLGSLARSYLETHNNGLLSYSIYYALGGGEWMSYIMADRTIFLSSSMAPSECKLSILINQVNANLNYLDITEFPSDKKPANRKYDVIYTGRFESTKGIVKLTTALMHVAEDRPDFRACLIGDGTLHSTVETLLREKDMIDQIELTGWIDHNEVPSYLAESRFLALPSESEGVPKSILEAMACRTVPIATPVGGIPDEIIDSETGFILPDNDPKTIEKTLGRALEQENLIEIANQSRSHIRQNHSYEVTEGKFRNLISN